MDYVWIGAGILALFLLNKLVLAPVRRLVVNVLSGLVVLHLINTYGYLAGFIFIRIGIVEQWIMYQRL